MPVLAMPDGALALVDLGRIAVAALAIAVLPGAAWVFALWPPGADVSRLDRLAWIGTLSYVVVGALALGLARIGLLQLVPLAAGLAVTVAVGVVASAVRIRRSGWRPGRPRIDAGRLVFLVAAIGIPALILLLPQLRIVVPGGYPLGSITWYYWGLTTDVVDAAAIPAMSAEWGGTYPYQGDYILFSAYSAALPILAGRASDFALMELLRLGAIVWAAAAGLSALRRFLPLWGSLIGVLILLGAEFIVSKFTGYRPESFHYALIFTAMWAVDRFRDRPTRLRAIPIVVTIAALWIGHGVVLVVAGLAAAAIVAGHWLVDRRPSLRELVAFGAVGVAGAVAAITVDAVVQGKVLLIANAIDPARIQGDTVSDLTWEFYQWALGGNFLQSGNPDDVTTLWSSRILLPWPILDTAARWAIALIALAPIALWRWIPRRTRALYAAGWLYLAGLLVVVAGFLFLYDTYVPQRVGFGRLAPFTLIGMGLLVTVGLTAIVRSVAAAARSRSPRVSTAVAAACWAGVLGVAVLVAWGGARDGTEPHEGDGLSADGYAALTWLRDNTPADAIVLSNAYTEGAIGTIARRNGLTDGRAPYNKEFEFLATAVDHLKAGRSFFAGETGVDAIRAMGVDYVVVSPDRFALANPYRFCDPDAEVDRGLPCFAGAPFGERAGLDEVASFGEIEIYRVEPE